MKCIHCKLLEQKNNLKTPKPDETLKNNSSKDYNGKGCTDNLKYGKTSEKKIAGEKDVMRNMLENKDAKIKDSTVNMPANKDAGRNTLENKVAPAKDARSLFLRLNVLWLEFFKSTKVKTDTTEKFTIEIEKYCNMCLKEIGNNDFDTAFKHLLHAESILSKLLAQKNAEDITKFYKNFKKDRLDDTNNNGTDNFKFEKILGTKYVAKENAAVNTPENNDAGTESMNNIRVTEIATTEKMHHSPGTNRIFSEARNVGDNSDSDNSINQNHGNYPQFHKNKNEAENTSIDSEEDAEKLRNIARDYYEKGNFVESERYLTRAQKMEPSATVEMLRKVQALTISNGYGHCQSELENCYKRSEDAFIAQDYDSAERLLLKDQELYPRPRNQDFLVKVPVAICDAKNRGTLMSSHEKKDQLNDLGSVFRFPNSQKFVTHAFPNPDLVKTSENSDGILTKRVEGTDHIKQSVNKAQAAILGEDSVKAEQIPRKDWTFDRSSFGSGRKACVYAKSSKDLVGCDDAWEECLEKAQAALDRGDIERGEKWVKRAQRKRPSDRGAELLQLIHHTQQQDAIRRADAATNDYDRIGVDREATLAEVKTAYRKLTLLLHTDRNHAPEAKQAFMIVTDAYKRLKKLKSAAK